MEAEGSRILSRMLDRLFAAIMSGPSLNCRPHSSRQRLDLTQLAKLKDREPAAALRDLLSDGAEFELTARVPAPKVATRWGARRNGEPEPVDPAEAAAQREWSEQTSLLSKLRVLVEEAKTYENDTGAYVLNVGYPLVSLPPGTVGANARQPGTRRILAPIAFIPVAVTIRAGASVSVAVECKSDEVDRVVANDALLAWIEQNTGHKLQQQFIDEDGTNPWREIAELVGHVARALGIDVPAIFQQEALPETIPLEPAPKAEDENSKPSIVSSAVLGLFPLANQGLLRDTQAMLAGEPLSGPIESFLRANVSLDRPAPAAPPPPPQTGGRRAKVFSDERLVVRADPCQARAVALARTAAGLVIHGPPGTGKSQTITNIIGDHLARGERVLFVCEKRTALDVVANRLGALGLGTLCAVVHDPQRDQRELYMSIRAQLESLDQVRTVSWAAERVAKIDKDLAKIHAQLTHLHDALSEPPAGGPSFHTLVGEWIELAEGSHPVEGLQASLDELEDVQPIIRETLQRSLDVAYPKNPWTFAAGLSLATLLAKPMDHFRALMAKTVEAAQGADAAADARVPAFLPTMPLADQAAARTGLLKALLAAQEAAPQPVRDLWARRSAADAARAQKTLADAKPAIETFRTTRQDPELLAAVRDNPPTITALNAQLGDLEAYLHASGKWWGFIAFGARSRASRVLTPLGLPLNPESATRARSFLQWLRAALVVRQTLEELSGEQAGPRLPAQEELYGQLKAHAAAAAARALGAAPARSALDGQIAAALRGEAGDFLEGLRLSPARASALAVLEEAAQGTGLFDAQWLAQTNAAQRAGGAALPTFSELQAQLRTLEDVLRIREALAQLPGTISGAVSRLVGESADPGAAARGLRRAAVAAEISRRLESDPELRGLDPRRVQPLFARYSELEAEKRERVRDAALHYWTERARSRLLNSTGSRLSSAGAEVRRRLTTRGRHAMRLRQVLALGRGMEGGDPLMDLRPVWMASPETVAQIFPREPVFDVVIFDEASQCRLEEALPVITRARRLVIAGDPRQLPPTRFFETALAQSEVEEIESDQQLFEAQQSEVEDLLGAALGLNIEQAYLDVHYRSRNSDLISFSNEHFYGRRLQAIPGHPRNRIRVSPLTLYNVGGTYTDRTNVREAEEVCRIVKDLLRRAEPPSIGIACFNLPQRDLIVEKLDELAAQDPAFGAALARARERRENGAAAGLFVKNLENVQGDERDHMIISTTYGPDPTGRFYRRFGPLAQPGGGRRLNVLITRAREEVHLVTSIPPEVYRSLPPIPDGQQPSGGWLLMAYLQFAEQLATTYALTNKVLDEAASADASPLGVEARLVPPDEVIVQPSGTPSAVAQALANTLKTTCRAGSIVHWGNDGFCVDLALRHPHRPEDVTIGVLCDTSRFPGAEDPVEWDLFRCGVLEGQGWTLHRVWSPTLFRDLRGRLDEVIRLSEAHGKDPG
jgi:hypothetical protein